MRAAVSRRETPQERSSETAPAGYRLKISSPSCGVESVFCRARFCASGCRERTRGQLRIPGGRPAGVYTAGAVQYMMNVQNYLPGRSAVVLGSGDIGLIMARRMKWEGIDVKMVLGERASGLLRNYIQCIKDWDIPIRFSHTVVQIHGRKRISRCHYRSGSERRLAGSGGFSVHTVRSACGSGGSDSRNRTVEKNIFFGGKGSL